MNEWHKCRVKWISLFALKSVWCHFWNKRLLCCVKVHKIWRAVKWKAKPVLAVFLTDIFPPVPQLPSPAHAQQGVHSSHGKQHLRQSEHVSALHFVAIARKQVNVRTHRACFGPSRFFLWKNNSLLHPVSGVLTFPSRLSSPQLALREWMNHSFHADMVKLDIVRYKSTYLQPWGFSPRWRKRCHKNIWLQRVLSLVFCY